MLVQMFAKNNIEWPNEYGEAEKKYTTEPTNETALNSIVVIPTWDDRILNSLLDDFPRHSTSSVFFERHLFQQFIEQKCIGLL